MIILAAKTFLASITANVGSILSPTLLREIQEHLPNRTAVSKTIEARVISGMTSTTTKPKIMRSNATTRKPRTTTAKATEKKIKAENKPDNFDLTRAQQTQFENQFPFDFRNNNYRDFSAAGLQAAGRQLNASPFADGEPFNGDGFRPFSSAIDGAGGGTTGVQGSGGRFGGNTGFNGANRPLNAPGLLDYTDGRFQDYGRFGGFNGPFPGSNRFIDQGFRAGGAAERFQNFPGQPDERSNLISNNYRADLRANYPNGLANDQNQFQSFTGSVFPQNSFDFLSPQRFQNPYAEGFDRNQQRGPSFPLFYPARPNDGVLNPGGTGITINSNQKANAAVTPVTNASRRSGEIQQRTSTDNSKTTIKTDDDVKVVERNQFERLYYPPLDDYSDVRVNPDAFKYSLASNIVDKKPKNNIV